MRVSTSTLSISISSFMSCLASSTTMAVISLVSEAIGTTALAFFSTRILPVSSSTTSTDCEPSGNAIAAALKDISRVATVFLIIFCLRNESIRAGTAG
ncbi:hypothetical protein D3C72_2311490 [compost metagenome]